MAVDAAPAARTGCGFLFAAFCFEMSQVLAEIADLRLSSFCSAHILRVAVLAAMGAGTRGAEGPRGPRAFALMDTSISISFLPLSIALHRPCRLYHWITPVVEKLLRATWLACHRCGAVVRVELVMSRS